MKRFMKSGLVILFLLLVLFGSITIHTILQSQDNGRLINYVGIVRGATQRLVKLELRNQEEDSIIDYLDGILLELTTGKGSYGLPLPEDDTYQKNLYRLNDMWDEIKNEIFNFRSGGTDGKALLSLSENYFGQANETVFAAEKYASNRIHKLLVVCAVTLGIMLITWVYIFSASLKKLFRLEKRNKKLTDLANRDPLTGVYQLNVFKEKAQNVLDTKQNVKIAVLYTDFTDFKYINDVFGYAAGDRVLKRYGEILLDGLKEGELCGRVLADHFVLLYNYQNKEEISGRLGNAEQEIVRFIQGFSNYQSIPICCGICCLEDVVEDVNIDGLLDRANYARKTVKSGTNCKYIYYDESIRKRLREEKELEGRMLEALEKQEFKVYYQPKVALETGNIASAEALVRWKSSNGSIIPPDRFIPVFERKLLIDRLDLYVYERVCSFLRQRLDERKKVLPVSVNVSRLQFYDQNFVGRYVEIRDRYQIPHGLLEIEFTESIAFDNASNLVQIVSLLKNEGFICSIDDFGKGYSSLSLLKSLPIDIIKIDSFFFDDSDDPKRDMAVVQGIVELVKKFHARTVAEGIESWKQVEYLKEIRCDYVQGYVYYHPMCQEDYARILDDAGV